MNRPKVICHILSSLDGRIDGDFFTLPETMALGRKYGQIRKEYNPDAILNGAITCADIFADGYAFFMCKPVFLRKNDMAWFS